MSAPFETGRSTERAERVRALFRARPRSKLLRATVVGLTAGAIGVWLSGELEVRALLAPRRLDNLDRFVTRELIPEPLRSEDGPASAVEALRELGRWALEILESRGLEAMAATLALAVAAGVLAGAIGLALGPLCARTLTTARPYQDAPAGRSGRAAAWRALSGTVRGACVGMRALPEYLLAFLLGAMLRDPAWAAVLALGVHNGGILARLYGETLENLPPRPFAAWRGLGAGRAQIAVLGLLPVALPRLLLYFFYRFETCVREATVLGMLGFVSLGYWIQDARSRMHYDSMILLVGLGVVIVLVGDLCSYVARAVVRRAS